jgi:hypothetical protein
MRGAKAVSLMSAGTSTWQSVAEEQHAGLNGPQTKALAAFSVTFLPKLSPPTPAHDLFKSNFDDTFHPSRPQTRAAGLPLSRVLSCELPDGRLALCGCVAPLGQGMEHALFTTIFHVSGNGVSGAIDDYQVSRSLLQASLDAHPHLTKKDPTNTAD